MTTFTLGINNTGPVHEDIGDASSMDTDNKKSLINIVDTFCTSGNVKGDDCTVAVCRKEPDKIVDPIVDEKDAKDIHLDEPYRPNGGSKKKPKFMKVFPLIKNAKGGDTVSQVEVAHNENGDHRPLDPLCQANYGDGCYLASTDHRKVVSQYFGRNKRCTQLLTDDLWLVWCRKHYQQRKYNLQHEGTWHLKKLDIIRTQIEIFEKRTAIQGWDITLRKTEQNLLDKEAAAASSLWESFLVPYLGRNKTFAQLYVVLDVIETEFQSRAFIIRDNLEKDMPRIEFLPLFPKGVASKPIVKAKVRALIPHVKAKAKNPTSQSVPQTITIESNVKYSPLIQTANAVQSSSLLSHKRKAPSPDSLEATTTKDSEERRLLTPPKTPPSAPGIDVVPTSMLLLLQRKVSSPQLLDEIVPNVPKKRRRLVPGIRPKPSHIKSGENDE